MTEQRRSLRTLLYQHWLPLVFIAVNTISFMIALRPGSAIDQAGWGLAVLYGLAFVACAACIVVEEIIYRRNRRAPRLP